MTCLSILTLHPELPLVEFEAVSRTDGTFLTCTASGGYPPITSITIEKGGENVASTESESIVVNTADVGGGVFGDFKCLVDNSVIVVEEILEPQTGGSERNGESCDVGGVVAWALTSGLCIGLIVAGVPTVIAM